MFSLITHEEVTVRFEDLGMLKVSRQQVERMIQAAAAAGISAVEVGTVYGYDGGIRCRMLRSDIKGRDFADLARGVLLATVGE